MNSSPSAIVLAAGLGTRLRPLTTVRAKPAVPVGGVPMIRRILSALSRHGIEHVVVNLHHLPETITRVVGDGSDLGVRVRYSWEPSILGTAGGPRLALPLFNADTVFIVNGDTLADVNLDDLVTVQRSTKALVTLALAPNREFLRYGGVLLDGSARVTGFVKRGPGAEGSFHFIGVQVAHATAFESLRPGEAAASIGGLYDRLIATVPGSVAGHVADTPFFDVGTVADYMSTSRMFSEEPTADPSTTIHPTARVIRSILWDDVAVSENALVEDCIVTDHVRIPAGREYRRSILFDGPAGITSLSLTVNEHGTPIGSA